MTAGKTIRRSVNRLMKRLGWSKQRATPKYIPPGMSVTEFFDALNREKTHYVVLRWFDQLPDIRQGEDIDILVSDKTLDRLLRHLRTRQAQGPSGASIKCDVRSVSGSYGPWIKQVAYYPPFFAQQILDRALEHRSDAKVPCAEDHFLSLAYHALYHKGLAAGLPLRSGEFTPNPNPDHDYEGALAKLASQAGFDGPIEMDAIDLELSSRGICPPIDIKPELLPGDPWFSRRLERIQDTLPSVPGLTVFVLRERGMQDGCEIDLIRQAKATGFHILAAKKLSEDVRKRASWYLRGSDWGGAKWPVPGGGPAFAVAAVDFWPTPPDAELLRMHPEVDNGHAFRFKLDFRESWNDVRPRHEHSNVIHSSDNARQAVIYLRTLMPELEEEVLDRAGLPNAARRQELEVL